MRADQIKKVHDVTPCRSTVVSLEPGRTMTIEVFPTTSIPQDALSPASEYLLAKWKTLKATGG